MYKEKKQPYIIKRFFKEEISPEDITVQVNELKETLNENIWENGNLKKNVRIAILKIAKAFNEYLKLGVPIKDVIFTGSLSNYNWTLKSDIDIHLILDLSVLDEPEDFIQEYIAVKKTLWNDKHDIKIKNFEVELYAKDEETLFSSKAAFSVLKNYWIQKPSKKINDIDEISIKEKAASIMSSIDELESESDDLKIVEKSDKIKEKIKKLRSSGLEQGGEYSTENLAFKVIRKTGYLEKLFNIKKMAFDSSLTLAEKINESNIIKKTLLKEEKEKTIKEYGCLMLDLKIKNWNKIINIVDKEDIYDLPDFGIETHPHITILYGLIPNKVSPKEIETFVKKNIGKTNEITVKIKKMSLFENKDFDVLKFDINSEGLHRLNKLVKEKFPYENDYPDYQPHLTIAYLKKGKGEKYVKEINNKPSFKSESFSYSYPPNEKILFNINKKENILGIEKGIEGMTPSKIEIIKDFINFVCNKLDLEDKVEIYLHKGRDEYIVTTASYVPDENSNHIRCTNRALVDILRSIAHELTHNRQREIESFKIGETVQTIGGWIEDEANAKAGILIKDFAMNLGYDEIYNV
jgi:hypothetical protein